MYSGLNLKLIIAAVVFAAALPACRDNSIDITVFHEDSGRKDSAARSGADGSSYGNALNFGITPWSDPAKLKKMYAPLVRYLEEQLGQNIRFIVESDYNTLVTDLKNGIVHMAAFTPGAYADALDTIPGRMVYVASTRIDGKDYYRGYIIVRESSPVNSLAELKGKKFAFVEKGSSSGYKYPLTVFAAAGINPFKHSKIFFLGSHPNVTDAVWNGKVDAGATWDGHYDKEVAKGKKLRILKKTRPIPYDSFVLSRQRAGMLGKLRKVLLSIDQDTETADGEKVLNKDAGFPYSGWAVHSPAFYDIVRETSKAVQKYQ